VAQRPTEIAYPSMRSLRDTRGLRRFLCRLAIEVKADLVTPEKGRTLGYLASRAAALDQNQLFAAEVADLQSQVAALKVRSPLDLRQALEIVLAAIDPKSLSFAEIEALQIALGQLELRIASAGAPNGAATP
jgi:hypothetical protein